MTDKSDFRVVGDIRSVNVRIDDGGYDWYDRHFRNARSGYSNEEMDKALRDLATQELGTGAVGSQYQTGSIAPQESQPVVANLSARATEFKREYKENLAKQEARVWGFPKTLRDFFKAKVESPCAVVPRGHPTDESSAAALNFGDYVIFVDRNGWTMTLGKECLPYQTPHQGESDGTDDVISIVDTTGNAIAKTPEKKVEPKKPVAFDPFKGYVVSRSCPQPEANGKPVFGSCLATDLTPQSHQVSPLWAVAADRARDEKS